MMQEFREVVTRQECLEALEIAAERLGESPTKFQYEQLNLTPSASTILRHCESWNAAKESVGLSTNPSTGSRVDPKPPDVTIPDEVEWEEMSQDQRWHYKHSVKNTQRSLQRRNRLRQWIHSLKVATDGCSECGESDPACLDFHHRSNTAKEMAVNKMVPYGYGREDIREEIEKCDILCTNCHWKAHHSTPVGGEFVDQFQPSSESNGGEIGIRDFPDLDDAPMTKEECLRAWTYAYKQSVTCQECGEDDPICLQFHHESEKSMGVGAMIFNCEPAEKVLTEARKCTVLCANCHRKHHYEHPRNRSVGSDKIL